MKHEPIPNASDPIKHLSARELLAAIAGFTDELETRGALADAPYELTQGLDAIAPAAREALDWLSAQQRPNMSRADWTGQSSHPGVL